MNCRRRMGSTAKSKETHADKSKAGNGKKTYPDKHAMERHSGFRDKPGFEGKGRKLDWN